MNTKRLVAAIGDVRSKLALVEDLLERGDDAKALDVIRQAEDAWALAMQELRA